MELSRQPESRGSWHLAALLFEMITVPRQQRVYIKAFPTQNSKEERRVQYIGKMLSWLEARNDVG